MTTAYAKINPNILSWARERAQLSLLQLAAKLQVDEVKLEAWESGEKPPTFKQAQNFAIKTHIPFGFLFLNRPPEELLPLPDLRTIGSQPRHRPSAELVEIIQIVIQRQQWFLEYLRDQGVAEPLHKRKFSVKTPIATIVKNMRKILRVAEHPYRGSWEDYFKLLVQRIEDCGILVMRQGNLGHHTRPLSISEFRGFAVYDPIAPVIFINQADAPAARLFTLIHELAHIWIGVSGISDADVSTHREEEKQCNAIAAEFLVPENEFLQHWRELEDWQRNLPDLEAHFHVSRWVLARRAQSLGKITSQQYLQYINDMKEEFRNRERSSGGPNYYLVQKGQISERFSRALVSETLSGRVLLREAAQLLGMKPNNIAKFAKELNG